MTKAAMTGIQRYRARRAWLAVDLEDYGPMPDYDAEPLAWMNRMTKRARGMCHAHGIVMSYAQTEFVVDPMFKAAKAAGKLGNTTATLAIGLNIIRQRKNTIRREKSMFKRPVSDRDLLIVEAKTYAVSLGLRATNIKVETIIRKFILDPIQTPNAEKLELAKAALFALMPAPNSPPVTTIATAVHDPDYGQIPVENIPPQSELNKWFPRDDIQEATVSKKTDEQTSAITGDNAARFFAVAGEIMTRYGIEQRNHDRTVHIAVMGSADTSTTLWAGTFDEAVDALTAYLMDSQPDSEATFGELKAALVNRGFKLSDFKTVTGYANRAYAYAAGLSPSDLLRQIRTYDPSKAKVDDTAASEGATGDEPTIDPSTQPRPDFDRKAGIVATAVNSTRPVVTTITGLNVLDIPARLDVHLPPEAYGAIQFGQMSGKTDLDGDYVRDRFCEVFGPMGIGWQIVPSHIGRVECRSEQRKDKTWYVVTLMAHVFRYSVVWPDGSLQWVEASCTSDQHDNVDEQYAYRGAMTSLMKQFYGLMGGINHVKRNVYTHEHAARELAARKQNGRR